VETEDRSSIFDRKAMVGSREPLEMWRGDEPDVAETGAEAGMGVPVALGNIKGFRVHKPEGKRRILRCRLMDFV
jgi:hypothetical protein